MCSETARGNLAALAAEERCTCMPHVFPGRECEFAVRTTAIRGEWRVSRCGPSWFGTQPVAMAENRTVDVPNG